MRIHNLSLATSSNAADIYRLADLDTLITWQARLAVQRAPSARNASAINADATAAVASALAGYRRFCAGVNSGEPNGPGASPGELVLPEMIKLMPLYVQCLLKTDAVRSGWLRINLI